MEPGYWERRWDAGQTGFHLGHPHPGLIRWWPTLGIPIGAPVLVPLCGKALDLRWLADRGHPVVGVEVSSVAVTSFYEEQGWTPTIQEQAGFRVYSARGVTIWQGDWWQFPRTPFAAIYDRASIIALPEDLRVRHVGALSRHLAGTALVITLDHGASDGPPFAVPEPEVRASFAWGDTDLLETTATPDESGKQPGRVEQIWRVVSHR